MLAFPLSIAVWRRQKVIQWTTIEVAERIAAVSAPLEERRERTGLLITLAGLRLPRTRLLAAMRRNPMIDELLRGRMKGLIGLR